MLGEAKRTAARRAVHHLHEEDARRIGRGGGRAPDGPHRFEIREGDHRAHALKKCPPIQRLSGVHRHATAPQRDEGLGCSARVLFVPPSTRCI